MAQTAPLATMRYRCADENATAELARLLARAPALGNAVVWLHGDLGAGKTTWVRHLLRALGVQGRIKSPTYAIVEPHQAPASPVFASGLSISHFDFYRFNDPREWEDAGFRELFAQSGLKLVEWPEKAAACLPPPDLDVVIESMDNDERVFHLRAFSPCGLALLGTLAA